MGPLEVLMILILWIAPSIYVAKLAERRGHGFWEHLVAGLLLSWLIVLVVVLLGGRPDRPGVQEESEHPPAGWYPDPNDPARQRYWDGEHWADDTRSETELGISTAFRPIRGDVQTERKVVPKREFEINPLGVGLVVSAPSWRRLPASCPYRNRCPRPKSRPTRWSRPGWGRLDSRSS